MSEYYEEYLKSQESGQKDLEIGSAARGKENGF